MKLAWKLWVFRVRQLQGQRDTRTWVRTPEKLMQRLLTAAVVVSGRPLCAHTRRGSPWRLMLAGAHTPRKQRPLRNNLHGTRESFHRLLLALLVLFRPGPGRKGDGLHNGSVPDLCVWLHYHDWREQEAPRGRASHISPSASFGKIRINIYCYRLLRLKCNPLLAICKNFLWRLTNEKVALIPRIGSKEWLVEGLGEGERDMRITGHH